MKEDVHVDPKTGRQHLIYSLRHKIRQSYVLYQGKRFSELAIVVRLASLLLW